MSEFKNPSSIYRGAPFWSWNNRLDKEQLFRQINYFKEMGMGGFQIHPRTGLETEYLGDEYLKLVQECCNYATEQGMLTWLYDEDRWPSGYAGGKVTENEEFRARYLRFTKDPYDPSNPERQEELILSRPNEPRRTDSAKLLATYEIVLRDGFLVSYKLLMPGEAPRDGGNIWYAYLETMSEAAWFGNNTYVDTLNPKAIERFIEITHEAYRGVVGNEFGRNVPAIFTDEPQFTGKESFKLADEKKDCCIPWTDTIPVSFKEAYKDDILKYLPEVFWELPNRESSVWRYRYHDHICERFTQAYSDTLGKWCQGNGIALTGHMLAEPTLASQSGAIGEAMRSYRSFDIPGIDILCDWMESEYATAKQAQSAAHQYGRSGVLSEMYGVTNWDFDFAGHKRQGDWQAALGVTYRVHHLSMVSMAGEAKRDYPASISYQSPWYKHYKVVEDHFARINTQLTAGKPLVRVGVIHPIESFWLLFGPEEQTGDMREEMDVQFKDLIQWLLYGFIDFDFISESLLLEQANEPKNNGFSVGEMEYDFIVVPPLRTIRSTTLSRLKEFADSGGKVLFLGEAAELVDAKRSEEPKKLALSCQTIPFSRTRLLKALSVVREVKLVNKDGVQISHCLHQIRVDGDERILFLCNTDKDTKKSDLCLHVHGEWKVSLMDTFSGDIRGIAAKYQDSMTYVPLELEAHGSLLLRLSPGRMETGDDLCGNTFTEVARLKGEVPISLDEPNVFLFDAAEFKIGEGEWQPKRHILEIDPIIRSEFNLPPVDGMMAQPWTDKNPSEHITFIHLRFIFSSSVQVANPLLALENIEGSRVLLDGKEVELIPVGYFADEAIQTVSLPDISVGEHCIELIIDYNRKTYIEWCYLLGDFGVDVIGDRAVIREPVRNLAFGDWTNQGLPFYGGSVTYHCEVPIEGEDLYLRIPYFDGPLVCLKKDGNFHDIAFAPYRAPLGKCDTGSVVELTVVGNRANCFGQLHRTKLEGNLPHGPTSWRNKGDAWSDEYQLFPMGILTAPIVEKQNGC